MIILMQVLKSFFLFLGNIFGFKRLPGGLYYSDMRFLERMVKLSNNGKNNVIFVKPGFYLFTGNDVAIYSHTEGFAMKADVVSVRWKKASRINDSETRIMGDANIPDGYVTLFECSNLRGRLFNDVVDTLELRDNLRVFSME